MAEVIGSIEPNPDGGKPLFRIIRREERAQPYVRPCQHKTFELDERWSTVTCGECGEKVDAFAALMSFATWWERLQLRVQQAEDAERRMYREALQGLARRRGVTTCEKAEIRTALDKGWTATPDELSMLNRRIERELNERRNAR